MRNAHDVHRSLRVRQHPRQQYRCLQQCRCIRTSQGKYRFLQ